MLIMFMILLLASVATFFAAGDQHAERNSEDLMHLGLFRLEFQDYYRRQRLMSSAFRDAVSASASAVVKSKPSQEFYYYYSHVKYCAYFHKNWSLTCRKF
jgi:hypothetical protein